MGVVFVIITRQKLWLAALVKTMVSDESNSDDSGSNLDPSDNGENSTTNQTWYGQSIFVMVHKGTLL